MRTKLFALVCLLVSFGLPMFGQTFGEIGGEIHDVSGAVIAGAEVTILNVATNAVRSATLRSSLAPAIAHRNIVNLSRFHQRSDRTWAGQRDE